MMTFKKMWDDVNFILSNSNIENINIVETFNSGFVIKDEKQTHFITKEDFIDCWCKLFCFNEIVENDLTEEKNLKQKYVYEIIKNLPYINEKNGSININE